MNLSIPQLLLNHSRNIPNDIKVHDAQYFDTEIPRFDDITEEREYKENLAQELRDIAKEADKQKTEAASLRAQKEKDKQILIEAKNAQQKTPEPPQ